MGFIVDVSVSGLNKDVVLLKIRGAHTRLRTKTVPNVIKVAYFGKVCFKA